MDIVVCTDHRFVMPTGVMMYSLCSNNPEADVTIHVLIDDNVTEKDKEDLTTTISRFPNGKVLFYNVDLSLLPAFPSLEKRQGEISKAAYYRLMLSEILPESVHKVLYMDGDLIVRGSLSPLWDTDLTGYAIAAVPDGVGGDIEIFNRLRYPFEIGYFNSGVMLVNLDYWREHAVINEFYDFIKTRAEDIALWDQDVLNFVFQDRKTSLPIKYNFTSGFLFKPPKFDYWKNEKEFKEALQNPVVVHFAGDKPWYVYQRVPHPFTSTWMLYQNQTLWKGVMWEKRSMKLRIVNFISDTLRRFRVIPQVHTFDYIDIAPID
jgi:lipopolysaccharide biosynthesis glycosyltransferase